MQTELCSSDSFLTDYASHYLVVDNNHSIILSQDGEYFDFTNNFKEPFFCINAPLIIRNTGYSFTQRYPFIFDIAELFIFFYPTSGMMPTLKDIANFLDIKIDDYTITDLYNLIIQTILDSFFKLSANIQKSLSQKILLAYQNDWSWAHLCLIYYKIPIPDNNFHLSHQTVLSNWQNLSHNDQKQNITYESNKPISYDNAVDILAVALKNNGEARPQQLAYIKEISKVFADDHSDPLAMPQKAILCEASTGTGKTLGYLAPALAWAHKNQRPAIISTYSKALQNQVAAELTKFYPNPDDYDKAVTMRKGRENYLCLKQYQSALLQPNLKHVTILYLTFIANWIEKTNNGDLTDITFPLWLNDLFPNTPVPKLTVSANECTYNKCAFYQKCFAEKNNIKSEKSRIIITNHAYLMSKFQNNAVNDEFSGALILDEAHHIFSAADNIYNIEFNLKTLSEFKSLILGHKDQSGQLLEKYDETINLLLFPDFKALIYPDVIDLIDAFEQFPNKQHQQNLPDMFHDNETIYHTLLNNLQEQLWNYLAENQEISLEEYALLDNITQENNDVSLFIDVYTHLNDIKALISQIDKKFQDFITPELDADSVQKIYYFQDFLKQKIVIPVQNFLQIISEFHHIKSTIDLDNNHTKPKDYIIYCYQNNYTQYDNFSLMKRYINPAEQFGYQILSHIPRLVLTSAGLRADTINPESGWDFAAQLTGLQYRQNKASIAYIESDFDYATQAKIIQIDDIKNYDTNRYIQAFIDIVKASKGGVLGLFTAISRLKNAYKIINHELKHHNILTLAMHQAIANNQTLIELFKQDGNAVLLGTDLLRDGIDIPGSALRTVIFERVPWHRTDLIYKKRCAFFKENQYDKFLVKQKLKQAFGRLIRNKTDKGCFVLVASHCPSHILKAFPAGCAIEKTTTQEAIKIIQSFGNDIYLD